MKNFRRAPWAHTKDTSYLTLVPGAGAFSVLLASSWHEISITFGHSKGRKDEHCNTIVVNTSLLVYNLLLSLTTSVASRDP